MNSRGAQEQPSDASGSFFGLKADNTTGVCRQRRPGKPHVRLKVKEFLYSIRLWDVDGFPWREYRRTFIGGFADY